ncbi:unnamed protein product [Acanthoscelides obtectus]|uniref:Uncharacterized protein n=1 Tax=Acanthoscelides obtectus TaxID=200917 RepID=A0A9P0P483_ACAOB|nr:unnamed protein product [Acanthoscelides obtectus]CAK1647204.1 hypothetical protein AOBTE_LOCUS15106 [Acanthoscelides obtectus]
MKFEDELEKLRERVNSLESQNIKFKYLLDSALDITNKSETGSDVEIETQFLQDAIKLIEDEKNKMQEDLEQLVSEENETVFTKFKQLENENIELRKKVDLLVNLVSSLIKDMEQLKREYSEFKFLLTQPNVNAKLLKNILQLNNTFAEGTGQHALVRQRYFLQRKIVNLESKKTELLGAIENSKSCSSRKSVSDVIKSDLKKAIFRAINGVAKKEFENLFEKVLELEKERSKLLSHLKVVLDKSKKEIASEYYKLQQKILDIETEKAALRKTLTTLREEEADIASNSKKEMTPEDERKIDEILNAFSNSTVKTSESSEMTSITASSPPSTQMNAAGGLPLCVIL